MQNEDSTSKTVYKHLGRRDIASSCCRPAHRTAQAHPDPHSCSVQQFCRCAPVLQTNCS